MIFPAAFVLTNIWPANTTQYMIDHGYIGNLPAPGELVDPCYIDEEFVDAHSEEDSMENTSISSTGDASSNTTANDDIHPPAIELPSSFPILASGCLTVPQFTNYAVDFVEVRLHVSCHYLSNCILLPLSNQASSIFVC